MGCRPELYLEMDGEVDFVAESNNYIPLFWALLFTENQPIITYKEELYFPVLTIQKQLHIPDVTFHGEVLQCWRDFTNYLLKEIDNGKQLVLYMADILLMEYETDELNSLQAVEEACQKMLRESIADFLGKEEATLIYDELLGYCDISELDPNQYPSLIPKPEKKLDKLSFQKEITVQSMISVIVKEILVTLCGVIFFFYCLSLIIAGDRLALGIVGAILCGPGTIVYFINALAKIRVAIAFIKNEKS